MKTFDPGQRARRLGTALLLLLLPALPVQARGKSEAWANTQFSNAERLRETLNTLPAKEQSRHEYVRVINAYRRVYYGAPASAKADPSVVAVADLLAEMGRCFNNQNDLRSAIGQYKFLRREYPGSRSRFRGSFQDRVNLPGRPSSTGTGQADIRRISPALSSQPSGGRSQKRADPTGAAGSPELKTWQG